MPEQHSSLIYNASTSFYHLEYWENYLKIFYILLACQYTLSLRGLLMSHPFVNTNF